MSENKPIFMPKWKVSLLLMHICSLLTFAPSKLQGGELCRGDCFGPLQSGLQDVNISLESWSSALGFFFLAFDKLVKILVHCQLRKFMDFNENVQSKICWNFHSGCCEHLIPFQMCICISVRDDFVNISIVNEYIEEIFGSCIFSEISGQDMKWTIAQHYFAAMC